MTALEIFYEICKIPHATGQTAKLRDFIIERARAAGCEVAQDSTSNIHIFKGKPTLCLQAHYDMVHIGGAIEPKIATKTLPNGKTRRILKSQDSSLGADNGVGVAAILWLSVQKDNFEAIITNDEEVGMIGANNITLTPHAKRIINLDSENINEICVGCAGGFDADIALDSTPKPCKKSHFYELRAINFRGGHSGIDINKGIPNAIVELLWAIKRLDCEIVEIGGGEKRNSIPVNARAIIALDSELDLTNTMSLQPLLSMDKNVLDSVKPAILATKLSQNDTNKITQSFDKSPFERLLALHNGVYELDKSVISSLNFSLISKDSLQVMVRANRNFLLARHIAHLKQLFGESLKISEQYLPWEREDSALLSEVKAIYKKHNIDYKIIEIHAGLECGILKDKCGLDEIISIGPTIENPHSKGEMLDLESFEKFCEMLSDLV